MLGQFMQNSHFMIIAESKCYDQLVECKIDNA